MKWEFSSMLTVSLVLIFTALSGDITGQIEAVTSSQLTLNILFGLGFFIPGIVGGILNENEVGKAVLTIAISFLVIGTTTALSLSFFCSSIDCVWVPLTLQGIPTAMVETSIGFYAGDRLSRRFKKEDKGNNNVETNSEQVS